MKKRTKKVMSMLLVAALTAGISISGTMAYLTSEDSDVNVMTLGNVKIEQHEYQRVEENGEYKTGKVDDQDSYVLEEFEQGKPLLPTTDPTNHGAGPWDGTTVRMSQVDSHGGMDVFVNKNAVDKFVTVENTGRTDAYIRTIVAIEVGTADPELIGTSYHMAWNSNEIGTINIDGVNYYVTEYIYAGAELSDGSWRHQGGVLPAGDTSYPNLSQVYLQSKATNEDCEAIDGNGNGTLDIFVLSQAVQAEGFDNAKTALDTAFGETSEKAAEWFGGSYIPDYSIPEANVENGAVTLEDGEEAVLSGNHSETITVNGNGTLYLRDLTAASIDVQSGEVKLVVEGDVSVKNDDGNSAITGEHLNISGTPGANLTAIAGDGAGAFGIGGMETTEIVINDLTIKEVIGGYDGGIGVDYRYYKDAPEGGSAIGSAKDGATITLNNVHIEKAIGGSKAAGIGARYWTGVTVNITDSTIDYVEGGVTAAGIGGSRVSKGCGESGTNITIKDSTIKAKGGVYGAGIGSGYDVHCSSNQPICTINITGDSKITAQGGQYAAGIGTGYHNAGLAGTIDDTVTVKATSGEEFYEEKYTKAQNVGFGVVDPAREAKDNNSSIKYNGTEIKITK